MGWGDNDTVIIDLHIHTLIGSSCSVIEIDELIKRALSLNIDGICITDHDSMFAVETVKQKAAGKNLVVLGGMEVRCLEGDVLVFGFKEILKEKISVIDLIPNVHNQGGIVIPVHPFRIEAPSIGKLIYELKDVDAIEILNGNSSEETNISAWLASLKLGIPGVGGSDAHTLKQVGKYVTFFDKLIKNEDDLIKAIKEKDFQALKWG